MNRYTLYCTPEQTKKALELSAPIYVYDKRNSDVIRELDVTLEDKVELSNGLYAEIPTAEQMIGWLEEQNDIHVIRIDYNNLWSYRIWSDNFTIISGLDKLFNSRKEATSAAIDAALGYLMDNKE